MKYLLAFALVAAASALPEPIRLLQPVQLAQPDIAPLMVPQEVMDQVALLVKFVEEAVNTDAADAIYAPEPIDAADYTVNFINQVPEAVYAPESLDASAYAVNIVEQPVAEASDVAPENIDDFAVRFVDEAVNADAPEAITAPEIDALRIVDTPVESDASIYSLKIVEDAEVSDDAPVQVKTIDIPLPESVVLPFAESIVLPSIDAVKTAESPLQATNADFTVKIVDVADVDEETPSYIPIKVYNDARLR